MADRSSLARDGRRATVSPPVVVGGTWLADNLLVLLGRLPFAESRSGEAVIDGSVVSVQVQTLADHGLPEPLLSGGGSLAVCRFEAAASDASGEALDDRLPAPEIRVGDGSARIEPEQLERVLTDLRTFLREHLAGLERDARARVLAFLTEACGEDLDQTGGTWPARKLLVVREALRERLPYSDIHRDEPHALNVDRLLSIDKRSFWTKGWFRDVDAEATRVVGVSPEGARAELLEGAFRHRRGDIERFYTEDKGEKHGFIKYFQLPVPSRLRTGWVAELHNEAGIAVESGCPAVVNNPLAVREGILLDLAQETEATERLLADQAYPALMRLQEELRGQVKVENDVQYGTPPDSPEVSIVIPIYGRFDLVEHQLAGFVRDPDIREAELIYVLDSPELDAPFAGTSAELHKLYGVPFRVVTLASNAGFSNATNVGVSLASGRLLLLMNTDVLPERPGWLSRMASFYDATESIGALAPKLMYEDESIQHAGVYFHDVALQWEGIHHYRETRSSLWENAHYFKGLHRALPAANIARAVPAVTAACLMIERALYEEIGGLRDIFVQGGYEDTDFCLRLMQAGRENWYLPSVELYHLEDQSYPSATRTLATKFNMWLHTRLWNEEIQRVMREQEAVWGHTAA